jgi:hypothetical protein
VKKFLTPFLILLVLMTLTKIDFRFKEIPPGLSVDDAEYYYHAQTLGIDFDLNYINQMEGAPSRNLNKDDPNIVVPVHPIGMGVFAAPFLFISNSISKINNLDSVISLNYYFYSLSSIFYLFLSILLLIKFFHLKKIKYDLNLLLLAIFGSGVSYFAFERFSMSHAYEFFGTILIFYLLAYSDMIENKSKKNIFHFVIGISLFLIFSIRWTNYFIFLIPFIYTQMYPSKDEHKIFTLPFFLGAFLGNAIYLLHTKILYGVYTYNPADLFLEVEARLSDNYERFFDLSRLGENIFFIIDSFIKICFGQEFGIFFFSPILFIGFVMIIHLLIRKHFSLSGLLILTVFIPVMGIVVLQNTAFSYGFRYLFALIPLFIVIYFQYFQNVLVYKYYLLYMSIFGFLGIVFFETSEFSILYSDYLVNIFGQTTKFVNPTYLSGVIKSFFIFDSYLNIVFTSFLGVLIIKILGVFTDVYKFIEQFKTIDEDISNLVTNSIEISWAYLMIMLIFYMAWIYFLKYSHDDHKKGNIYFN